ncbi:Hypothetical protein AAM4_1577, partial [Actinomyces succiniciruminis]
MVLADTRKTPRTPRTRGKTCSTPRQQVQPTGLSPSTAPHPRESSYPPANSAGPRQQTHKHAPQPRSRNPCRVITRPRFNLIRFRSPLLTEYPLLRVLRCFTSPRNPPPPMNSGTGDATQLAPGTPIRKPSDHSPQAGSPRHIAGRHVLHRLLVPRHPPNAQKNNTNKHKQNKQNRQNNNKTRKTTTSNNNPANKLNKQSLMLASAIQFTTNPPNQPHPQPKQGQKQKPVGNQGTQPRNPTACHPQPHQPKKEEGGEEGPARP